jgi:heme-degrading monooxygenase HmoA
MSCINRYAHASQRSIDADGNSTKGDLQGYADGDLIAFVVHWRDFQAITTWVGQLDPKASQGYDKFALADDESSSGG